MDLTSSDTTVSPPLRQIGFVATGTELVHGEILNTNTQYAAQQCLAAQIEPGTCLVVPDQTTPICDAILYLLRDHDAIITIGGLGPTSDDLTRYALAKAVNQSLIFHDDAWAHIVKRLNRPVEAISDNNRQQCLFPNTATLIPNPNGTAYGCWLYHNARLIYMLPGPPFEFSTLFDQVVLPHLKAHGFSAPHFRASWWLTDVCEGDLAQVLDGWADEMGCHVGYRVDKPRLQVKVDCQNQQQLTTFSHRFQDQFGQFIR